MNVTDQCGAAIEVGLALVDDGGGSRQSLFANDDKIDIATGSGKFGAGAGGEQGLRRIADAYR
jgi:hypothetical protein